MRLRREDRRMPPSAMGCTSPLLKEDQSDINNTSGRIKCVLVGDGAVGKTSLVVSYSTNGFPNEYVPTAFDNFNVLVKVDGQPFSVQLCDTAGQDDFDPLRSLCYPDTDVFLLCFSVVCPTSFQNISDKWLPEVRRRCPDAALLLIGTQSDRRRDVRLLQQLARYKQAPVTEAQARELARRVGAATYVETSALTQRDLKEAFDQAIVCALRRRGALYAAGGGGAGPSSPSSSRHTAGLSSAAHRGRHLTTGQQQQDNGNNNKKKKQSLWQKLCCFS